MPLRSLSRKQQEESLKIVRGCAYTRQTEATEQLEFALRPRNNQGLSDLDTLLNILSIYNSLYLKVSSGITGVLCFLLELAYRTGLSGSWARRTTSIQKMLPKELRHCDKCLRVGERTQTWTFTRRVTASNSFFLHHHYPQVFLSPPFYPFLFFHHFRIKSLWKGLIDWFRSQPLWGPWLSCGCTEFCPEAGLSVALGYHWTRGSQTWNHRAHLLPAPPFHAPLRTQAMLMAQIAKTNLLPMSINSASVLYWVSRIPTKAKRFDTFLAYTASSCVSVAFEMLQTSTTLGSPAKQLWGISTLLPSVIFFLSSLLPVRVPGHCTCQAQIANFCKRLVINSRGSLPFPNEDLLLTVFSFKSLRFIDEEDVVLVKAEGWKASPQMGSGSC